MESNQYNKNKTSLNVDRRHFIKTAALGAGVLSFTGTKIFAGPFDVTQSDFLIPADKKLTDAWIRSLYERGVPEVYSRNKEELKYIGMPVGGIACGQLYLAGDGRLRFWHIFKLTYTREIDHGQRFAAMTLGGHYEAPEKVYARETRPVDQGTVIKVSDGTKQWVKRLDATGFSDINFRGEYPIGKVEYKAEDFPLRVNLEAFSPFIPGNAEESALPATVLEYKVTNKSNSKLKVDLLTWLENAVLPYVENNFPGIRRNTLIKNGKRITMQYTPEAITDNGTEREDIVFEDFESGSYVNWTVSGKAFGTKPYSKDELKHWQPLNGYKGNFFVNTHNSRDVSDTGQATDSQRSVKSDEFIGALTSKEFTIERNYINFIIGGGAHGTDTSINLIVDGQIVRSASGTNSNNMRLESFDVKEYQGEKAILRLVDNFSGGWGHISLDHIVFSDKANGSFKVEEQHGFGSMALSVIDNESHEVLVSFNFDTTNVNNALNGVENIETNTIQNITSRYGEKQVNALGQSFDLKAGETKTVRFLVSWFFPHLNQQEYESGQLLALKDIKNLKRHYFNRFNSASQVADYIQINSDKLIGETKLWNQTWYDSTLPYWLLDRAFIPIDCLATNTVAWFSNGRFYGWEGVECCPGTCQHVWHYAQGMARVFPEIERWLRENIDFGSSLNSDGSMGHRDETAGGYGKVPAHDGHCGTIIRAYREHRMSSDNTFLSKNYSHIKRSIQYIINEDKDRDGILEGGQHNTLDASWYGPMGWISSLYHGALAVGKEMAMEMDDVAFAQTCEQLLDKGQKNMISQLFNGEYFIHKPDPEHPKAINSNDGCLIDQVLGQSLAFQAGLRERVVLEKECKSALKSIWKYNFAPDAFWYQKHHKPIKGARIYATEGEAGTLMCTWPKGGAENAVPGMANWPDESETWLGPGGYFDECMNGFEYQVASHLIFEGEIEKGLALTKAVHDRYTATKRNPFNEIECSDHYSRSMASYGVFIAICGFNYHGPKGELTIDPKIDAEDFKAPFTVAEGWGTISQQRKDDTILVNVDLKYGKLKLSSLNLKDAVGPMQGVEVYLGKTKIETRKRKEEGLIRLEFEPVELNASENLVITSVGDRVGQSIDKKITVFPNPFSERINIQTSGEKNTLAIYDLKGKKMYCEEGRFMKKQVDLTNLPEGIYVVHLEGESGSESVKVIKTGKRS